MGAGAIALLVGLGILALLVGVLVVAALAAGSPTPHGTPIAVAEPPHHDTAIPPAQSSLAIEALPTTPPDFMSLEQFRYDEADAKSYCRTEWTKRGELDTGQFNYCVNQERDRYKEIPATLKKFGKYPWMATLFPAIWTKWTKRGVTQYSMVAYELKQETDKFLDYEYEGKQPTYNATKMSACLSHWADHENRWSMTMYCYKQD